MNRLFPLTIAAILFLNPASAFALSVIERDDVYIYYPDGAEQLAEQLMSWYPPMANYLKQKDIPLRSPIHIILDQNLDRPGAVTQLYPHREIRLPMRAPGVFEDGYTERDPWRYYLFKGLCDLAIYNQRSGIPAGAYRLFGEVVSPNIILPDWTIDGYSNLLYERYTMRKVADPLAEAIFKAGKIPSLDRVSHHPEIWPGQFSYRIYGRPFIRWLYQRYGWQKMLIFLQRHGRGILPIEIDLKARYAFGMSWHKLWRIFRREYAAPPSGKKGIPIVGYWNKPKVYWNEIGVYPGVVQSGTRSRYGFMDRQEWLWISEYVRGVSRIKIQQSDTVRNVATKHVWDPGPGSVAVGRRGHTPVLIRFGPRSSSHGLDGIDETVPTEETFDGPTGVLQMSGPVMDAMGRIAVAANVNGNWDVWLYDQRWYRVTDTPSIEADPWFVDDMLIFTSNVTGTFQIHGNGMVQLTDVPTAALLPRHDTYLGLDGTGWQRKAMDRIHIPSQATGYAEDSPPYLKEAPTTPSKGKKYAAWKSLWPNYIAPDYFFNADDFQLGLATHAADVSRTYAWNAGFRYDFDDGEVTWRLGYRAQRFRTRVTRYPLRYTTQRGNSVDEKRFEVNLSWSPACLKELTLASHWRRYAADNVTDIQDTDIQDTDIQDEDWWASLGWKDRVDNLRGALTLDAFSDGSQSLYGEVSYGFGEKIHTITRIQGGKTWGDLEIGHNTFRIGGNSGEGYFTQRYSRLFSLRGFDSNILEAGQAASASLNVLWPLVKLQSGYRTLPLFLHNITVNTFMDAGFAADHLHSDDMLVSAGIEFITGMQVAWYNKSHFRMGLAWPLKKPSDIQQEGPTFLILVGRPL